MPIAWMMCVSGLIIILALVLLALAFGLMDIEARVYKLERDNEREGTTKPRT